MATNFLKLFKTGSARLALVVGASEVGCGAGRIYTWSVGSGHFMAWAVDVWDFSISSFPLPASANIREVLLSSLMDRQQHHYLRIQNFLPVAAVDRAPPPWCQSRTLLLDFLLLDEQDYW